MKRATQAAQVLPMLAHESVYIGIDVGKFQHVAGFVSTTLLARHERFESCPVFTFEQSLEGFRRLIERIEAYTPLAQCFVLLEKTGHYHKALEQYLLDLDVSVYLIHVQTRSAGLLKTDKRDALLLANHLYNQLEKGIQVASSTQVARRVVPPTEAATLLRGFLRHRYELIHETTRRKNKLTSICDELFPEFTTVLKDPNSPSALALRQQFPTPAAIAAASLPALAAARPGRHPSLAHLTDLHALARRSVGAKDPSRQRTLIFEQTQLITELELLQRHLQAIDAEILQIIERSREGQILTSIPGVGPIQAASIIAAIGHIENFSSAAKLKAYFGWAPAYTQTGITLDHAVLTKGGLRPLKHTLFLVACNAIRMNTEWARIYERLVPIKCAYDER